MITQQSLVNHSSFNLNKLGWGDPWTASKSCRSKLSVTGDMAKYLVFNPLQRWCTFPIRLSQPLLPWCSFCSNGQVKTKTRPFRSNPSDQPGRVPSYNSLPPSVRLAEFSQLNWSRQSPYDSWLHWKLHDLNVSNLFVPGWPSFKWDTHNRHRDGSGVTTQHKTILPISTQVFH
jgi:hypothetical protein